MFLKQPECALTTPVQNVFFSLSAGRRRRRQSRPLSICQPACHARHVSVFQLFGRMSNPGGGIQGLGGEGFSHVFLSHQSGL